MKISFVLSGFLLVASGLAMTPQASACEAGYDSMLFAGYARNVKKISGGCTFQVELDSRIYPPKVETNCPLFPGEVGTLVFNDPTCSTTEGQIVSGVMSLNRETGETAIR